MHSLCSTYQARDGGLVRLKSASRTAMSPCGGGDATPLFCSTFSRTFQPLFINCSRRSGPFCFRRSRMSSQVLTTPTLLVPRNNSSSELNTPTSAPAPRNTLSPQQVAKISVGIAFGVLAVFLAVLGIYWWRWGKKREWGKTMRDLEAGRVKLDAQQKAMLNELRNVFVQAHLDQMGRTDDGQSLYDIHHIPPAVSDKWNEVVKQNKKQLGFGESEFLLMSESGVLVDDTSTIAPSDSLTHGPFRPRRRFVTQQENNEILLANILSSVKSQIPGVVADTFGIKPLDTVEEESISGPSGTQPYQQSQRSFQTPQDEHTRHNLVSPDYSSGPSGTQPYPHSQRSLPAPQQELIRQNTTSTAYSSGRHHDRTYHSQSPMRSNFDQPYELENLSGRQSAQRDPRLSPKRTNYDQSYRPDYASESHSGERDLRESPMRSSSERSYGYDAHQAQLASTGYVPPRQASPQHTRTPPHSPQPSQREQTSHQITQILKEDSESDNEVFPFRTIALPRPGESVFAGGVSDFQDRETAFTNDPWRTEANQNYEAQRQEEMMRRGVGPQSSEQQTRAWIDESEAQSPYAHQHLDGSPDKKDKGKGRRE
jgi:hypothetical protein